jgi:hypothetical protein
MKIKLLLCSVVLMGLVYASLIGLCIKQVAEVGVQAAPETPANGSVIFWEDSLLVGPISRQTGSRITHAAVILDGYVYEAVPPCVHKVLLADYVERMRIKSRRQPKFKWFVLRPQKTYLMCDVAAMKRYAGSQLGRPYSVRGWWRGCEVLGIFCSQYVANILEKSGIIKSAGVHESPVSLYEKLGPFYD